MNRAIHILQSSHTHTPTPGALICRDQMAPASFDCEIWPPSWRTTSVEVFSFTLLTNSWVRVAAKRRVGTKILPSAASELPGGALTSVTTQGLLIGMVIDKGKGWVGFVCTIIGLLFKRVFAAMRNLALIRALLIHHHGERPGSMRP